MRTRSFVPTLLFQLLVGLATVPAALAGPGFQAGFLSYEASFFPVASASADLDHDGLPDLVVASYSNHRLTILRGLGRGTFAVAESLNTQECYNVAISDLDGDGNLDLVSTGNNVTAVFLGTGGLAFQPRVDYGVQDFNRSGDGLAVADVTGDGIPDVIASDDTLAVQVRPGLGNGALAPPIALAASGYVYGLVAVDLDGDGDRDIAFSEKVGAGIYYQVVVALNQGGGAFAPGTSYPADSSYGVAAGDLDSDGRMDLVAGARWLRGLGGGTFAGAILFGEATEGGAAVADIDRDGALDVATLGGNTAPPIFGSFRLRHGHGDGTFDPAVDWTTGAAPTALQIGDVDGDGNPDVVASCYSFGQVCVHRGLGPSGFVAGRSYDAGGDPSDVLVADLTGDGFRDVVVASPAAGRVRILLGLGDGTLGAPLDLAAPIGVQRVAAGDVNGDGILDLVSANGSSASISVFPGTGGGGFGARADYAVPGSVVEVAVADIGGDGLGDVIALGSGVSVLQGGAVALGSRADYAITSGTRLSVGLLDGDFRPDIAVLGRNQIAVLPGRADGTLGAATTWSLPTEPAGYGALAIFDADGDGDRDLAAASIISARLQIRLNDGSGVFTAIPFQRSSRRIYSLEPADFDGDGREDLVSANFFAQCATAFRVSGAAVVTREAGYGGVGLVLDAAAGDLDGDGDPEIVVCEDLDGLAASAAGSVTVMRNLHHVFTAVRGPGPSSTLTLSRVWPVPATDRLRAAFTLASSEPAFLELIDVSGRRLRRESVGAPAVRAGVHELRLEPLVGPGMYWLRLVQGPRSVVAKAAVLR